MLFNRKLWICIGLLVGIGTPSSWAYEVEESLAFEIQKFPVDHQGPQVIDVEAELVYKATIGEKDYPDFEEVREQFMSWMTNYPNETDYWEIFIKKLGLMILEAYPTVAAVTIEIKVYPTYSIQYAHTSRCTLKR